MSMVEKSVQVNVPVSTAYNQWTQFEQFPEFMDGITEVKQLDATHLHWRADIGGRVKEWDAEITEQKPDERVAWKAVDGAPNAGVVTFHRLEEGKTRVMLQLEAAQTAAAAEIPVGRLGTVEEFAAAATFLCSAPASYITGRGEPTGAWRGNVESPSAR